MRVLPSRRIATALACAVLALGAAAPVAAESATAPAPDTVVLGHAKTLGELGGLLTPVAALVEAALTAEGGTLSAEAARKHTDAIKAAAEGIDPAEAGAAGRTSPLPAGMKDDTLARVRKDADALAAAAQTGDTAEVRKLAEATTNSLIGFLAATVITEGLPAPELPGLPRRPAEPAAGAEASLSPSVSASPSASESKPASDPASDPAPEPASEPPASSEPTPEPAAPSATPDAAPSPSGPEVAAQP